MRPSAAFANVAWLAASLPEYLRFRHAATRTATTQRGLLQRYIRNNADTAFGRMHDFAGIHSYEDWATAVPVRAYDDYANWIEAIAAGEQRVLTAQPVRLFEPSSGSSGAEKWIPYTAALQAEFRRAVATWICDLFLARPALTAGRAYWSLTPPAAPRERAPSAVPVGFDEDSAYLGGIAQRLVQLTLATPAGLPRITDTDEFWRVTAESLSACHDLRLISAWHPSFVLLLRDKVCEHLGSDANPWPRLGLVSCWGDAQAAALLPDLQAAFPGVTIQPKGLLATEGVVTLPIGDGFPLALRSHFFEFESEDGAIRPAWNLDVGEHYQVILTTGGGLYRYALRDRVRVDGFLGDTPCLRFVGKADAVSDLCGEKLSEEFVATCLSTAFDQIKVRPRFALLAPDDNASRYCLFVESREPLPDELGAALERELQRGYHYELCRRLGQLQPLRVVVVKENAYRIYADALVARGMRLGDIKPTPLSRHTDWSGYFEAGS